VCIRQLQSGGMPAVRNTMPDGRHLITWYCQHNEAGVYGLARDGIIDGWTMRAGMPIEEWQVFAAQLPENIAVGMVAMAEQAAEHRQTLN